MITDSDNIVSCFRTDIGLKLWCEVINIAGIHQILPYKQTILITEIIKFI